MTRFYPILLSIFAYFMQINISIAGVHPSKFYTELPYINKKNKTCVNLFYNSDTTCIATIDIRIYKFKSNADSILVLARRNQRIKLTAGSNRKVILFDINDTGSYIDPCFYEVLKRMKNVPPGSYRIYVAIKSENNINNFQYLYDVDSLLRSNSALRQEVNGIVVPTYEAKSVKNGISGKSLKGRNNKAGAQLSIKKNKIEKVAKKRGLTTLYAERNNQSYVDFFYRDWFAGRYEVSDQKSLSDQIAGNDKLARIPALDAGDKGAAPQQALFSKYKERNRQQQEQEEIKGEIEITTNLSTDQEQYSSVDNNYYELKGKIQLPINDLPVEVEGMYTSQDVNRKVKSSYFRVHYDASKAKDELKKMITSYNGKYAEFKSKSLRTEQAFSSAITNLEHQKNAVEKQTDLPGDQPDIDKDLAKKKKIEELDGKIAKYKQLLEQSKNTRWFDSSGVYSKTKDIKDLDGLTQKQLIKKGENLFPEGKAHKFVSGITSFDAGMFSKNESKYIMGGQMIKGFDVGYDLGFCEAAATAGKTEYVGRDGNLDKYTCFSGKAAFRPLKDQKIILTYYGYSPDRKMVTGDAFFKNQSISTPSFFNPVHILSTSYTGTISGFLTANGEVAKSIRQTANVDVLNNPSKDDNNAYHIDLDGNFPGTSVGIQGSYDKTGKGFVNSTLPVSMSGTEQYRIAGKSDVFRSFMTLGIEFDRLVQQNMSSAGTNTKWGFDIKTHAKRYPALALSYKPFATFRSFSDTLNIPQRPLIGSVWTGKISYQFKRQSQAWRFSVLYNRCSSVMDTTRLGTVLMQASCMYTSKQLSQMVSSGIIETQGSDSSAQAPDKMKFANLNTTYSINKRLRISFGQDVGWAQWGLCKLGGTGGTSYTFQKKPVTLRVNFRYNTYQLDNGAQWKKIYSGLIDMTYRFKTAKTGKN